MTRTIITKTCKSVVCSPRRDFQQCGMCDRQSLRSAQSDQSLCYWLKRSMTVKLLPEPHLEILSLK